MLIDNHDSFVHNLARYFRQLGQTTMVVRSDLLSIRELKAIKPSAIIISPGPCTPNDAGCSLDVIRQLGGQVPILGVCLGHQVIGQAWGARIIRGEPVHGIASEIHHDGTRLFSNLPSPLAVGRYHSLVIEKESIPDRLKVIATTDDDTIMAVEDRETMTFGVQFHPESMLTYGGYRLLANFLRLAGLSVNAEQESLQI